MGKFIDNMYEHEGYAARRLPDGTLTGQVLDYSEITGHVAACDCGGGWNDPQWYGSTEYPSTEEGEQAALEEWERVHARPLLVSRVPDGLDDDVAAMLDRLRLLAVERPVGVLGALRRIERGTDDLLGVAVGNARTAGQSWSEIGSALGMAKQSAQQRFTPR